MSPARFKQNYAPSVAAERRLVRLWGLSQRALSSITGLRLISTVAAVASIFLVAAGSPVSAAPTPDTCFAFDAASGTITNYYEHESNAPSNPACPRDVEIPGAIGGVTVVQITGPDEWTSAFSARDLTSVVIPGSVTTVTGDGFASNPLVSLTYNGVVHTTSEPVSWQCYEFDSANAMIMGYRRADFELIRNGGPACLSNSIAIPSSIGGVTTQHIADGAFSWVGLTAVELPNTLISIGGRAFADNNLTMLTIPSSVRSIGNMAFSYNQLTNVTIQQGVDGIGAAVFHGNQIRDIVIPQSVSTLRVPYEPWSDAGDEMFLGTIFGTQGTRFWRGMSYYTSGDRIILFNASHTLAGVQEIQDSQWIVRVHLADASNPRGFTDYSRTGTIIGQGGSSIGTYTADGYVIQSTTPPQTNGTIPVAPSGRELARTGVDVRILIGLAVASTLGAMVLIRRFI